MTWGEVLNLIPDLIGPHGVLWSWILAIVGFTCAYLVGLKKKIGWMVGLLAQTIWIVFGLVTLPQGWGFIFMGLGYGSIYLKNWLHWRTLERKQVELIVHNQEYLEESVHG